MSEAARTDAAELVVAGQGLHTGAVGRVRFVRRPGPLQIRCADRVLALSELSVAPGARSTTVASRDGHVRIGTVEHLFAALGALGVREGVEISVEGPEIPLADGCARTFFDALLSLGVTPSPPRRRVTRAMTVRVGESVYELSPGSGVCVEVDVDFGDARLERRARWDGSAEDFRRRIAGARTFGFEREIPDLVRRGLASHVGPESVVVICADRILSAGPEFMSDEPARHKLLDLVGDIYVHGGPFEGHVRARRPGHAATHEALQSALDAGAIALTK